MRDFFSTARAAQFSGVKHTYHETVDKGHGRIEVRRHWLSPVLTGLARGQRWKGLKALGLVESERIIGIRSINRVLADRRLSDEGWHGRARRARSSVASRLGPG